MRIVMLCGVLVAAASVSMAQTTLDDFESYADTTALQVEWVGSGQGLSPSLEMTGGAASSAKWMKMVDADSYAGSVTAADLGTPAAGNYKVTFYYKNGDSTDATKQPAKNLQLFVKQGGNNLGSFDIPDTLQETWTAAETNIFAATATPIEIFVNKNNPLAPVAPIDGEVFAFDQIVLVPVTVVPPTVSLFPGTGFTIGNSVTLTATVGGGSGTFTSVGFDVNNDSTIDFTDNTAPYEFTFDTRTVVPTGIGTVAINAIVTDSASATGNQLITFNVDNRWGGHEPIVTNSGFENWTAGMPDGWVANLLGQGSSASTVAEEPTSYSPTAGKSMKITFAASDYTNRYAMRSVARQGKWVDLQTWYWGKGTANRMFYCVSTDGTTWPTPTQTAAGANNASWVLAKGSPMTLTMTDTDYISVMTHNFAAGDTFYDDVISWGTKDNSASVDDWKLF